MSASASPCPECPRCPETNGLLRRVIAFGGLALMFAAVALKVFVGNVSDWLVIGLALVGGALIPNTRVVDLLQAWQRKASS